jgi:hypothetical protein
MLFDLRGRRRRAVQATYLILALLMGGGLVLFGIGGSVSGGLVDALQGNSGGGGDDIVQGRIDRNEDRVQASPANVAALKELVRDHYQLATADRQSSADAFSDDEKQELREAAKYWQRYVEQAKGKPDPSLAAVALQIYSPDALNEPKDAARAMTLIAAASNDVQSYLQLVQYAALAGDERTADLAAQKAEDLAPKDARKQVRQQAAQLKKAAKQQHAAG